MNMFAARMDSDASDCKRMVRFRHCEAVPGLLNESVAIQEHSLTLIN